MKEIKWRPVVLALVLCLACAACGPKEEEDPETSEVQVDIDEIDLEDMEAEIEDWSGGWNTLAGLAEDEEHGEALTAAIAASLGAGWQEDQASELVGVVVKGNSWRCYSAVQPVDGSMAGDIQYSFSYDYMGSAVTGGGQIWHQFQSASETPFQYMVLTDIQGEAGELQYFYCRYGDSGFEELLADQRWQPMLVSREATPEQLLAHFGG